MFVRVSGKEVEGGLRGGGGGRSERDVEQLSSWRVQSTWVTFFAWMRTRVAVLSGRNVVEFVPCTRHDLSQRAKDRTRRHGQPYCVLVVLDSRLGRYTADTLGKSISLPTALSFFLSFLGSS